QSFAGLLDGVTTVVHLAGATKALRPQDYYTANAGITEIVARAVADRAIRLIYVSSLAAARPSPHATPLTEHDTPPPLTNYGKTKLEADRIVRQLVPGGVIVRPPVVYGPRDTGVFTVLKSISRGILLQIAGGERWFSHIYVHDLVEGLLMIANTPAAA